MSAQSADSARKASTNHLNRQLGLYSIAAAAAGVSLLALAPPAAAEVIVTHKTIPIPLSYYPMRSPVRISLTNNGVDQIGFSLSSDPNISYRGLGVEAENGRSGGIFGRSSYALDSALVASALPLGAKIGPASRPHLFLPWGVVEASATKGGFKYSWGPWAGNLQDSYIGVRFLIDGEPHYGWVRLRVTTNHHLGGPVMAAKVLAYAYETEPNTPIYAGTTESSTADLDAAEKLENQPGPSLGMLAAGADSVQLWRREESAGSN